MKDTDCKTFEFVPEPVYYDCKISNIRHSYLEGDKYLTSVSEETTTDDLSGTIACVSEYVLKKATLPIGCTVFLSVLLYDASRVTSLLYACLSILMTSFTVISVAHHEISSEREKEKDRLFQMRTTIAMETVQREALERENANLQDLTEVLQADKTHLEEENKNLWREISTLQSKVDSLESCLQRITDSDSSDESDDEEDQKVMDCNRCIICMERERNIVTAPCKHICLCSHCVRRVKHCPLCKKKIKKPVRVFSG
ncbi:baculoviral IAP repeat-containing protein 3-like [Ptychodera flava]|uniref:baculoviral IAP repeat-containing protein 3-like n=1 Tax=Ptychodera flava TaxID=63121 RepID=UPI00396A89E5